MSEVTQLFTETGFSIGGELRSSLKDIIFAYDIRRSENHITHLDLKDNIQSFLSGKKLEGLSDITLYNYEIHLRIFSNDVEKEVKYINVNDIRKHLSSFSHLKPAAISTKLSVLKSFFSWLTEEDILPKDPTAKIKNTEEREKVATSPIGRGIGDVA